MVHMTGLRSYSSGVVVTSLESDPMRVKHHTPWKDWSRPMPPQQAEKN
jgi:hypothetical protein